MAIAGRILLAYSILLFSGCALIPETEGMPPVVFIDRYPLERQLGKVGVLRRDHEIMAVTPTNRALFTKEIWGKITQGANTGFEWFKQKFRPVEYVEKKCRTVSDKKCSDAKMAMGTYALVALAVGGIIGGLNAEYSESLASDLEDSLLREVAALNDKLQSSILASAKARVFDQARGNTGTADWALQAFNALEAGQFVDLESTGTDLNDRALDSSLLSQEGNVGSLIEATVILVNFTDDEEWFSSGIELRVTARTVVTRVTDNTVLDERQFECVSVPRSHKFWTTESYRHVREEITACVHLLGQQVANDLLGASIRIGTK